MDNFQITREFQLKMLNLMCRDYSYFLKTSKHITDDNFEDEVLAWFYNKIKLYWEKYQEAPQRVFFKNEMLKEKKTDDEYKNDLKVVMSKKKVRGVQYIKDQTEEFVRRSIFYESFNEMAEEYNSGNKERAYKMMSDAGEQIRKFKFDKPDRTFFFRDFAARLDGRYEKVSSGAIDKIPTGIRELDKVLRGGLGKGQVGMFMGDAKMGKSMALGEVGFNASIVWYKVLHIVLEENIELYTDRYEARFNRMLFSDVEAGIISKKEARKIKKKYGRHVNQELVVRAMVDKWDYTVQDIWDEMEDLKADGFVPDLLIVDYIDLLHARESWANKEDKVRSQHVVKDLKTVANRARIPIWTATQTHRIPEKIKEDESKVITKAHVAEDYNKVRVCNVFITMNQTMREKENMYGRMRLFVDASRSSGSSKIIRVYNNFEFSMLNDPEQRKLALGK